MAGERGGLEIELSQLVEQLDDILDRPIVDPDDALEVAIVAGLAHRLGAPSDTMAQAIAWRDGVGRELLEETWTEVDLAPLLETLDEVITSGGSPAPRPPPSESPEDEEESDEEEGDPLENALFDIDDIIAAAIWCGRGRLVRKAARELAETIRQMPDSFVSLSPFASDLAKLPTIAEHLDLYDYWLAISDARALAGE